MSSEREENVAMAQLADQAERYEGKLVNISLGFFFYLCFIFF